MMEFYDCSDRRAKKEHKCDFCNKTIRPGEKYSYEKGKYDGEFFTRKLCNTCALALSMYLHESLEDEIDWWRVSDWLVDEICSKCSESVKDKCNGIPERCELGRMMIVEKWEG